MTNYEISTNYETSDIGCASYLVAIGKKLIEIQGSTRKVFVFESNARPDADAYWKDDGEVNPKKLISTMRELKTRLYNDK